MSDIDYNDQQHSSVTSAELLQAIQEEMQKPTKDSGQSKSNEYIFLEKDKQPFDAVAQKFADSNHYPFERREGLNYASVPMPSISTRSQILATISFRMPTSRKQKVSLTQQREAFCRRLNVLKALVLVSLNTQRYAGQTGLSS